MLTKSLENKTKLSENQTESPKIKVSVERPDYICTCGSAMSVALNGQYFCRNPFCAGYNNRDGYAPAKQHLKLPKYRLI